MEQNVQNKALSLHSSRQQSALELVHCESQTLAQSLELLKELSTKHNIDLNQLHELLSNKDKYASIPLRIFRSQLSPLQSLVVYLKDEMGYAFVQIAQFLKRDEATIWTTYQNSIAKGNAEFSDTFSDINFRKLGITPNDLMIPLHVFSKRKLSVLEHLCIYLREQHHLSFHQIGELLKRNDRTIWTVIHRAKKKIGN